MADEPTLSAADLQMRHNLDGAPDPFPTIADSPKISRKTLSSAPIDVGSESAFPSLSSSGPATTKAPTTTWSGPKLKAAQANLMLVESFTLTVMDLSTAGKDGKPTTLGEIMKQVMAKHKVKVEASSNQRTHQTTFNVKSESQKELDKAKRMLLALLSPVVTVTVDAPTSTIPHIIGPKGANLNSIREQTGVKIDIPKRDTLSAPNGSTVASHAASPVPPVDDDDEEPTITVSITGPKSAAYEAQELVNRIIAQKRSKATQRVRDIPTHVLPFVKSQRAKFEAAAQGGVVELKLDQAAREISVSGDRPTVLSVIDVIRGTVEEYTTGLQSIKTSLPKRQHRLLTGKNADDIMRESKCTVVIADPDDEDNEITIWGKSDDIGNGITAALSKANSQYIHEFPLPGSAAASRQLATYMTHIKYPETLSNAHSGVHVYLPSPVAIQRLQSVSLDIIGDKPLVDAAVRQVSELVGKLILATDEAEVDWLVHRILQNTKNGKKLKELSQIHNVRIFFPPESQERSAVLLVYDPTSPNASSNPNEKGKNLKAVKTELLKLAKESADVKSDTITVDPKWHQAVLGHNGTTLNAIIGEDKSVSIKFGQDGSDVVHIHGTSSEVDRAVNEIHRIVEKAKNDEIENSYVTEFDIDREYVSRIVGTGGSGVNRIRDQLGVQLDLSNESQDRDKKKPGEKTHVKITGREENVEEAKKRILAQAERIADEVSETIKIPAQYHSALIGQGGKYAIRLEDNYNVKVTFPRHGESGEGRTREPLKADEVLIKGGRKGVAHAKKELLDALEVEKENSSEIKFTIPRRAVPRVLGRGGATIKDIKDDTGTQIDVDKEAGETTTIVIKGFKFDVQEAKARILEISSQVGEESTDTVIIESKLHRAIIGAGGQGLRDLIARAGGPPEPRQQVGLIRFPPAGEGASDEIHLRGEPKVIAKLKVELEKAAADIRDRIIVGVEIPVALHRVLIGRGGQHLNDLQTRTNTQVQFPGSRSYNTVGEMTNASELADVDPANIVKVLGRKADCEKAIADLKTSATKEVRAPRPQRAPRPSTPGDVTATVTVPLKYHHIISNQGQFFRNLRSLGVNVDHSTVPPKSSVSRPSADADGARIDDDEGGDSGVRLQIIPNYQDGPEGDAEWTLKARDQENLERAQKRLQDAIDQASRMTHIGFLSGIEKSAFPRIIGSKGATISRLRDETGADVNVGKEDDIITIAGSQAAIEHAKEEIVKITTRPRGGRRDD